jgi:NAD(P)-dependent dehydrogenase (short-subunit alcohol dehydrogenase family)
MSENKTAVITGGAQGIGRIMADTLLQEGWNVAVWDNDEVALEQEEKRLKGEKNRIGLNCNVACAGSVNISLHGNPQKVWKNRFAGKQCSYSCQ